jgi:hypothetical protein
MSDKRQKNQLVLAFTEKGRSEAPKASREGTESRTAKCETERPARREQLMDECHSFSHTPTEAQSERGQERGGSTSRAEVLGVQLQSQQGTEAAHCAKGPAALQAENSGTDATDTRDQSGTDAEGTYGLLKGLEELLRFLSDSLAAENSGSMDTASSAFHDLEAMETWHSAIREAPATWDR